MGVALVVFLGTIVWSRFSNNSKARNLFETYDDEELGKDVLYADDPVKIEEDFGVSEVRIIKPASADSALTSESDNSEFARESGSGFGDENNAPQEAADENQHIIVLHVTAKPGETFKGNKLCRTLEHFGLKHGKYKIYHRESLQNPDVSLFSVANMIKPGYFEVDAIDSFTTPGISFFLVLPGPHDPVTTFNEMVQTARQVAQQMSGEILDAERSTFSTQRAQLIRDEIVNFMHRLEDA